MRLRHDRPGSFRALVALVLLALLPALAIVVLVPQGASAHGAAMVPGSRTYLCWYYSRDSTGAINPTNPACRAALNQSGSTPFYNWFAVLRSDGAGRTEGFIPDGKLCSGAATIYDFNGFDLPRNDWPYTHLTAGATMQVRFNNWAAHPGEFRMYITNDSYSPTEPLTWADLDDQPFDSVTNPPANGGPGSETGYYYWDATLPSGKTGKHIIYWVWQRSDSAETFYGCSDVVFDGGHGEVTVPTGGDGGPPTDAECTATSRTVGTWSGGFQAEVTVTNTSDRRSSSWLVGWMQPAGNTIQNLWNGSLTVHEGGHTEVANANWNGTLQAGGTTTFGYVSTGSPPPSTTVYTCGVTLSAASAQPANASPNPLPSWWSWIPEGWWSR